ncbi:uncharacterized protein AB9W97_019151 [Spinachia spinachia]
MVANQWDVTLLANCVNNTQTECVVGQNAATMAPRGTFAWLCSLAVFSCSAGGATVCNSQTELFERLSSDVTVAAECAQFSMVSSHDAASLLLSMRRLSAALHRHQLTECQAAEPQRCPQAKVPPNGGLACATVANKRYCKPLCNHGYDFAFLRRSRPYDECSEQTGSRWRSQYVGGDALAVCQESPTQVSGAKTAYFPEAQDCLTTKSSSRLQSSVLGNLTSELRGRGVDGEVEYACLVCG